MIHNERIYVGPFGDDKDYFIAFFDRGSRNHVMLTVEPQNVTGNHLENSAAMFKLPTGAYAIVDIYEIRLPGTGGHSTPEIQLIFAYEVHRSRATEDDCDDDESQKAAAASQGDSAVAGSGSTPTTASGEPEPDPTTPRCGGVICGLGPTEPIPCEDPFTTHAACVPDENGRMECVDDEG